VRRVLIMHHLIFTVLTLTGFRGVLNYRSTTVLMPSSRSFLTSVRLPAPCLLAANRAFNLTRLSMSFSVGSVGFVRQVCNAEIVTCSTRQIWLTVKLCALSRISRYLPTWASQRRLSPFLVFPS